MAQKQGKLQIQWSFKQSPLKKKKKKREPLHYLIWLKKYYFLFLNNRILANNKNSATTIPCHSSPHTSQGCHDLPEGQCNGSLLRHTAKSSSNTTCAHLVPHSSPSSLGGTAPTAQCSPHRKSMQGSVWTYIKPHIALSPLKASPQCSFGLMTRICV